MNNQEERIQYLVNGDLTDNDFVLELLEISRNEPDDLVRGIALCHLKEKSPSIIQRLLLDLKWRDTIG